MPALVRGLASAPGAGMRTYRRIETAHQRNRVVAALAERIFVAYAEPGSKTEFFCREVVAWGKPLHTHVGPANQDLIAIGATPYSLPRQ